MRNPITHSLSLVLILLFAVACTAFGGSSLIENRPPTEAVAPRDPPIPEEPSPSPLAPTATVPPTATPSPTATPTTLASIPNSVEAIDFNDLSPYRQAMLPEFAGDVDTVAAAGASYYFIDLNFDPDSFNVEDGVRFSGKQSVHYTNIEAEVLTEIFFRLYPNLYGGRLEIETVVVNGQPVTPRLEADESVLRVILSTPLSPGDRSTIDLTYTVAVPPETQDGYNIFSYSNQTAALATFYPVIAVYDDQGWNLEVPTSYGDATYLDISLYQVQVTVPQAMVVTASGSLLASIDNDDGTKTNFLASGPVRDFYLAMRADYQSLSDEVDGTVVNSYYPPDMEAGGQRALRYAVDALRLFNQRFGQYPYAEFDIVATPTTAGGVEYPGLVILSDRLYDQRGGFFQHAVAHEVAHQWWYALVGNDQVNEPWLDEALTNYSTIIYWEEIEGQETAARIVENFLTSPYQRAKEQGKDRAVVGPVSDFTEVEYGTFVYSKGPLFFDALRQDVGDELYFQIMKQYYSSYKYRLASAEDLFDIIETVSGSTVEPLVDTWLLGR